MAKPASRRFVTAVYKRIFAGLLAGDMVKLH